MKNIILFIFLFIFNPTYCQKINSLNSAQYRFTVSVGIGGGYPMADGIGVGASAELTYQKDNKFISFGIINLSEFNPLSNSNVTNSINSINLFYGKSISHKNFRAIFNTGLGFVFSEERGKFISSDGSFLGRKNHEKIKNSTVGLPISIKGISEKKFFGIGLELYANLNSLNSFYGISICTQFGRFKPILKK